MSDDNVTPLPVRPKIGQRRTVTLCPTFECQHLRAIVDEKLAELECADCHEKLNPIRFLATMAQQLTRWEYEAEYIKKVRAELAARKRCRCLRCGEWTEIRPVSENEAARIRRRNGKL